MNPLQILTFLFPFILCTFFSAAPALSSIISFESIDYGTIGSPYKDAIPPGQAGDIYITVMNSAPSSSSSSSSYVLRDVHMQARTGSCVENIVGEWTQPLIVGGASLRLGPFRITMKADCERGQSAALLFVGTYRDTIEQVHRTWIEVPFFVQSFPVVQFAQSNIGIPVHSQQTSEFTFSIHEQIPIAGVTLSINIQHPYIGDLVVHLEHVASGQRVELHRRTGRNKDNIVRTWGRNGDSLPALSNLHGLNSLSDWKLTVVDEMSQDDGHIESLNLVLYAN